MHCSSRARFGACTALAVLALTAGSLSGTTASAEDVDAQRTYAEEAATGQYVKLDLLALNDFHGQLEKLDPKATSSGRIGSTPAGGGAYLGALLQEEREASRAAGATPITVAAGDLIGASPLLSAAFHDEPTIEAMNQMGLQVASVGNHEFDEGWRELRRMQEGGCLEDGDGANGADSCPGGKEFTGADFTYLGANVVWKERTEQRPSVFPGVRVMNVQGEKVGFIGMTLEDTDTIVSPSGIREIDFADEVQTANGLVPVLRQRGVRSIVVLLHEGVQPATTTDPNACDRPAGPALDIAEDLSPAIDAVVSGHTHQPYNCVVQDPAGNPRLLTSASSLGRVVTKLNFLIDTESGDIVRPAATARNVIVENGPAEPTQESILSLIAKYNELVAPIRDEVVGGIAPVDTRNSVDRTSDADGGDSALGNLIADAQKVDSSIAGNGAPVIALMNPGGIRADLLENEANDVTYGAAFNVQPFNNLLTSMDLTGAEIKAALNQGWNGGNESSRKILQVSGLSYTWSLSQAQGTGSALVGDVMVDADGDPGTPMVPLEDGTTYRVAMNNFIADGGDGFTALRDGGENRITGGLDIDSLVDYLRAHAEQGVQPTPTTRVSQQP